MKVLIINKFLYSRGGDCIYALNLSRLYVMQGMKLAFMQWIIHIIFRVKKVNTLLKK